MNVYSLSDGTKAPLELPLKLESGLPRVPLAIRFDEAGERLAESCLHDQYVQVWDLRQPADAPSLRLFHSDLVNDIAWHPKGEVLAIAGADACIRLHDISGPVRQLN